jgi:hypothetical protein
VSEKQRYDKSRGEIGWDAYWAGHMHHALQGGM